VLEAMASGAAVLSSDLEPVREFAEDSVRYFDAADTDSIREALLAGLENSEWRQQAGVRGRARAERFSWEASVRRLIEVYGNYAPASESG
jgi:glycosyltransferase involved in cell wall biosynthesis